MRAERKASERLRVQDEALRFAGVGLYRYRYDGTIVDINDAAMDIMELRDRFLSTADVVGHNIENLIIYIGPRGRVRQLVKEQGAARNVLYPFLTVSGHEKWALHDSFAVKDPTTGEEVVQGIIKDVTELKKAEEALRESEERLSRVLETIAEGIVILSIEGRITFANAAAEKVLGLSRGDILDRSYRDPAWRITTVTGEPFPDDQLPYAQVLSSGKPVYEVEHAIELPSGRRVLLSVNAAPLRDASGTLVGVVTSMTDVTERKRLEVLRDEFLSTAAHELKTPVATIKGYAQLIAQWLPDDQAPRVKQATTVVNRQCDRINRLVQELLEMSRLQLGRLSLHLERFDLGRLAGEIVSEMQVAAPRRALRFQGAAEAMVMADRDRIAQVLFNLLDNAVKYSPEGGAIDVCLSVQSAEVVVAVRDRGVGIPTERQPHIFERYYRAHGETPYDYSGMGIGLSLSRELVTRHGGKMWFRSASGQGSTFYFSLPLSDGVRDE